MRIWYAISVYLGAGKLGFKQVFTERLSLFGSFLMYSTIIVAYSSVFRFITFEDMARHGLTYEGMVWYVGATELVLFCCSSAHFRELQYDIQSDQVHLELLRPCPSWIVRIGGWSGQYLARLMMLIAPCAIVTGLAAGDFNLPLVNFLGVIASASLAALILLCSYFIIGVSCLWIKQAEPLFWIWQKGLFLFGALLWPLTFYPDALSTAVWFTPFPSMLAAVGEWTVTGNIHLWYLAHQLLWLVVFVVTTAWVNRVILHRIQKGGE